MLIYSYVSIVFAIFFPMAPGDIYIASYKCHRPQVRKDTSFPSQAATASSEKYTEVNFGAT